MEGKREGQPLWQRCMSVRYDGEPPTTPGRHGNQFGQFADRRKVSVVATLFSMKARKCVQSKTPMLGKFSCARKVWFRRAPGQQATRSPPIGGAGKTSPHKNSFQTVEGGIFGLFSNFDQCRREVTDDVISGVAVHQVGMDASVKYADSTFDGGQITVQLPVGPVLRTYMQYSVAVCSRPEVVSQVISGGCMRLTIPP